METLATHFLLAAELTMVCAGMEARLVWVKSPNFRLLEAPIRSSGDPNNFPFFHWIDFFFFRSNESNEQSDARRKLLEFNLWLKC